MKVYLLWYRQSSGDYVIGVYADKERAQDRIDAADGWDRRCMDIEEYPLE